MFHSKDAFAALNVRNTFCLRYDTRKGPSKQKNLTEGMGAPQGRSAVQACVVELGLTGISNHFRNG